MQYLIIFPVSGHIESFDTYEEAYEYLIEDAKETYEYYGDSYSSFRSYFESEYGNVQIISEKEAKSKNYI